MAKLPRVTAKIFASNAAPDDIGQYGSALTGTKVNTNDIATIQALPAYEQGWRGAVISTRNYPTLQEMNGLQKSFSQQIAYTLQNGMPEWDEGTTYYTNQFCRVANDFYFSLTDENKGNNPKTDNTNWSLWAPGLDTYANQSLSNLNDTGEAHFANPSLSNLNSTGNAKFANPSLSNLNSTGNAKFANPSLSNLNSTGNAKLNQYFKTTGGTVSGNITILRSDISQFVAKLSNMSYNSIPEKSAGVGGLYIDDKDGEWMTMFKCEKYTDGKNQAVMQIRGNDGSSGRVELAISADGEQWFNFPKCTTRATTTSSARGAKVAVIVQNYVNGNSWYRVYSDGWIEQGGKVNANVSTALTFPMPFKSKVYYANRCNNSDAGGIEAQRYEQSVSGITLTKMLVHTTSYAGESFWYACGY